MAERVVKVSLTAQVSNYIAGMEKAAKATAATSTEAQKLGKQKEAFDLLGKAALVGGAAVAAGVGVAIAKFADFDQAMSFVSAATHESAENMALLRQAALDAGAETVFSATEAANAVEELGKAGLSTSDILGGALDGSLALAAAGGLDVAEAATIAATAVKQFNLQGSDVGHVADLLAAGAGKAQGDVTDLGAALNQAGLVAKQTGLTIDETTAGLAAFAAQGLLGSDAGTSFKTMLQRLTPQSLEAKNKMRELGISAYDAQGQFIGLEKFAGVLRNGMKDLTPEARNAAMSVIFGSDAVRAASVIYDEGSAGIKEWTDKVDDSGYAAETAALRMDNLKGDIEQLGGSIDTVLIQAGSAANDTLRGLAQGATNLVNAFGALPVPLQQVALGVAGVTAAVALSGGAFLLAAPKIVAYQAAIGTLVGTSRTAAVAVRGLNIAMGAIGLAIIPATIVLGKFANDAAEAASRTDDYTTSLDQNTGAVTSNTSAVAKRHLQESGILDLSKKLKLSTDDVTKASIGNKDALARVNKELEEYSGKGATVQAIVDRVRDAIGLETDALKGSKKEIKEQKEATDGAAVSTGTAADAYKAAAGEAAGLTDEVMALTDEVNKANGIGQDAVSSNIAYQDALSKVDEQIKNVREGVEGYAAGLDVATQSGRDNYGVLLDQAKGGQAAADAQFALDGNTANYVATLQANRDKVLQNAKDLGATDDQIQYLSDHIVAMPNQKQIDIIAETNEAQRQIQKVIDLLNSVPASRQTSVGVTVSNGAFGDAAVKPKIRATGGAIIGPGTGTSDSIAAYLSNGEHVLTAADVAAMGGQSGVYAWRQSLHSARGYATGGAVSSPSISVAAPSLDGLAITGRLEIGGDGLARIVDGRIQSNERSRAGTSTRGIYGR